MADISGFTSKFRIGKTGAHHPTAPRSTRRPRLVCEQCQKSKLRCDRGQPCSSCIKKDEAGNCTYQQPTPTESGVSRNTAAEDRLLHLESLVKQLMRNEALAQRGNGAISPEQLPLPEDSRGTDSADNNASRGKPGENTRYVGSTHWSAILDDIHDLEVTLSSSLGMNEVEEPVLPEASASNTEVIFGSSSHYPLQQIFARFLPPKVEMDRLLSIYFQSEAYIIPFIHKSDFQRKYREFWKQPANVNPLWLSMLFSICYIACLIRRTSGSDYISQNELDRLDVAAGQCLVLGEYYRPQKFTVEALALYAQCKNLRTLDPSREAGAILGIVIRIAYEMGYHRDPDSFGSFTVFEGEMRRRAWAACKQMDLMISFQLGLPSNICVENCDTKSPRNLLDSDFDIDTTVLPESRAETELTNISWFIVKERQMIGFGKVCQDALSFKEKSEVEILQLDKEIREMYTTIPLVLRARPVSESIGDSSFVILTRLYLDFIHLKSLCVLHRRYMALGNEFSNKCCVDAGTKLVSQFNDMYKELAPGCQLYMGRWMLTNFTMNDYLMGVMVLCLVIYTRRKQGSQDSAIDTATEDRVLALLEQSHAVCVENSGASRDARRVSHAIRLTLDGAKSSIVPKKNASRLSPLPHVECSEGQQLMAGNNAPWIDSASLPLTPWQGYNMGDEAAAFGPLDPFNFMGNDIENVDWSVFDL